MSAAKMLPAFVLVLVLVFPAFLGSAVIAAGQEASPPQGSTPGSNSSTTSAERESRHEAREATKEKELAGEEDPNVAFRHSAAVKLIARITGLSVDAAYWACVVLNLIVVIAVLWALLRKTLPAVYRNRTEAIQRRMEEARKASEDARRRLSEVETRLSRLDVEIEQMRREAEASGHREEERVMAAAEEERRRIVESAEQEIARAANAARRELRAYAAELGVSLAETRIRITEGADQKLVRDFTARLGKDGN